MAGENTVFLTTVAYIGLFVVGVSILGFAVKLGIDSLKLHIDRKNLESHEKMQKAIPAGPYGNRALTQSHAKK